MDTHSPGRPGTDRAAAVRHALRRLVAHHGFHWASMAAVAKEAGDGPGGADAALALGACLKPLPPPIVT